MKRYFCKYGWELDEHETDTNIDSIDFEAMWSEVVTASKHRCKHYKIRSDDFIEMYKLDMFLDCLYNISYEHISTHTYREDKKVLLLEEVWNHIHNDEALRNQLKECYSGNSKMPYRLFLHMYKRDDYAKKPELCIDNFAINMIKPFILNWSASTPDGHPNVITQLAPKDPKSLYDYYLFEKATHFSFCFQIARMKGTEKRYQSHLENTQKISVLNEPPFYCVQALNHLCRQSMDIAQFEQLRDYYFSGMFLDVDYQRTCSSLLNMLISKCGQGTGETLTLSHSKIEKLEHRLLDYITKESECLLEGFPIKKKEFFCAYKDAVEECSKKRSIIPFHKQQEWHKKFLANTPNCDFDQIEIERINTSIDTHPLFENLSPCNGTPPPCILFVMDG